MPDYPETTDEQNDETRPTLSTSVLEVLQQAFGFDVLRRGQDAVVAAVMQGRDAMAIMPTGGGKSLCYQLPALCREGVTVVVSPLIALMKDQVDALQTRGIPAAAINSTLSAEEYRQAMADLQSGNLKLLYVAPERFSQTGFMNALRRVQVSLLAIDEAHCLSQWGHDFRPDYLRLGRARRELGCPQTLALTATATEQVRQDILSVLELNEPAVIISGFGRDNLDFRITYCDTRRDKFDRIAEVAKEWRQGIVYCSTRKTVMLVFEDLVKRHINAVAYHAGMTDSERAFSQDAFLSCRADVVVATNAFGMGIDRADVRFVVHFEIPGSVEAYYQEAGRAGRDGEPAVCELLFNPADLRTQEFFYEGANPPLPVIRSLYNMLRARCSFETHELQMTADEMTAELGSGVNPMAVSTSLSVLMHAGAIERYDIPGTLTKGTRVCNPAKPFEELDIDLDALEEKAHRDHLKIEAMSRYANSFGCRQKWILDYFGELNSTPCGHCDQCAPESARSAEELTGEEATIVRKALAGVARASKRGENGAWEAIYGKGKIMDMLRGAKNASMHVYLTRLSTYGLLKELTDARMKALFRAMQEAGLLERQGAEMPLLTLSPHGEEVMMSRAPVCVTRRGWCDTHSTARAADTKQERLRRAAAAISLGREERALYDRLAALRRELSEEYGMPAFRIMRNDTLHAFATIRPTTRAAATRIKGVGPWMEEHVVDAFIELICDYENV